MQGGLQGVLGGGGCKVCWRGGGVVGCARDTTTTCLLLCYTGVHLYTGVLMGLSYARAVQYKQLKPPGQC